jgi:hypothetical protein
MLFCKRGFTTSHGSANHLIKRRTYQWGVQKEMESQTVELIEVVTQDEEVNVLLGAEALES